MQENNVNRPTLIQGGQETLCIRVPKVYDWVTRQADIPTLSFNGTPGLGALGFNCDGVLGADPCSFLTGPLTVECIPTDANGNQIDPLDPDVIALGLIEVRELTDPNNREDVTVTLPGPTPRTITLQRVKVLKKGFVRIRVTGASPATGAPVTCISLPQQWVVTEKFFLCAPRGTRLSVHITDFQCDAHLFCGPILGATTPAADTFRQLDVNITMCQDVQMEAIVKLEIDANFCMPRPEIPFECPPFSVPQQCMDIFPTM
ncbi:hypothetical protein JQN58_00980 [Aneurinibacillus sp. BA2021]|nr:hypothetical protein [Aneurinibacillus sp. BA2021]